MAPQPPVKKTFTRFPETLNSYCASYLKLPDYPTLPHPSVVSPTHGHLPAGPYTVLAQRPGATTDTHNSASHVSALASMIASENFTITRDVSTKTRSASTGGAKSVAVLFDWTSEGQDKDIEARLGIGRVHARRLDDAGYSTPESLVGAGEERIGKIVGPEVARNAIREVEIGGEIGST